MERVRDSMDEAALLGFAAEVSGRQRDPYTLVEEIVSSISKS
jgi:hypothetical protein